MYPVFFMGFGALRTHPTKLFFSFSNSIAVFSKKFTEDSRTERIALNEVEKIKSYLYEANHLMVYNSIE